jgi:hypothetical protein
MLIGLRNKIFVFAKFYHINVKNLTGSVPPWSDTSVGSRPSHTTAGWSARTGTPTIFIHPSIDSDKLYCTGITFNFLNLANFFYGQLQQVPVP